MRPSLASIKLALFLFIITPSTVLSTGKAKVDVRVQADIHSSMHMQWQKLNEHDERYQQAKIKLKMESDWILLPYGLHTELQTNDADKIVALRIDDLISSDRKRVISKDQFYISIDGGELHSAIEDLPLLHAENRGDMQKKVLLFVLKVKPNNYSGSYSANFKFITNTLP